MLFRKINLTCLLVCIVIASAIAQNSAVIRVLGESNQPLEGAIIILQALQKNSGDKQQIYFSDARGEAINNYPYRSYLFIQAQGYESIADTIESSASLTFHLKKLNVDLNEVVVTGQYDINTSDKSVYNVRVIDQKTIASRASQNLADLLTNELNTQLTQDNILGSSVSIAGISGQGVKILIDGVNVIGRENGNVDLNQINLNNVERVEIIQGPMSVSYGTDAIGGLINIVTRKSSSYPLEADLNLYYETAGTYNGDGALLWRKNNSGISITGGRYFFDGFSTSDTSRYMQWKPRLQYFGNAAYNYSSQFFNLSVKSDFFSQEIQNKGNPVLTPYQAYAFDDYYFTRRLNEYLLAEWRLKNNGKIQLTNAYSNYRHTKNTYRTDLVSLDQTLLVAEGSQDTSVFDAFSFRGTYSNLLPTRKLNFQAGYDINLESGKGEKIAEGRQRIDDYAVFGSFEYQPLKNFYVRPGLRGSYNTRYGAPLTPSLNMKYDVSDHLSLRASYARGFRAPSLKELDLYFIDVNHNILGNDSLKAEHSDNYSLSFTSLNTIGSSNVKAEASFFYNNINDIITLALVEPVTQLYTYINLDNYQTLGGTFTASFRTGRLTANAGFSLTGLNNSLADSLSVPQFSWTPEFMMNFLTSFPKIGFEAAVYFKNTGTTPGYSVNSDGEVYQTFIDSYTMIDVSVTKYFSGKRIALSAGVKNLLNVTNIQTNTIGSSVHSSGGDEIPYSVGRFVFGTLRLRLYKDSVKSM